MAAAAANDESQSAAAAAEAGAPFAAPRDDRGLGATIAAVAADFARLLTQHWSLARAELIDSGIALGVASLSAVAALVIAFLGVAMLLAAAALALALVVPLWAAFAIVGGAALLLSGGLLLFARARSRRCTPVPRRAIASLQQNLVELGDRIT